MLEPEIARRCPFCGASFREQAFFCPQCGREITQRTQRPQSSIYGPDELVLDAGATLTETDFQKQLTQRPQTSADDSEEIITDGGATLTEADFQKQRTQQPQTSIHDPEELAIDGGATLTEADFQKQPTQRPQTSIHDTDELVIDGGATLTEADFHTRQKPEPTPADQTSPSAKVVSRQPETPRLQAGQRALGEVGARIQRATTRARDVEENVVQRVQKFREMSSVVIDEAGYDPSLRFVLVAAALFVLFLVILLLNKLIG